MTYSQLWIIAARLAANIGMLPHLCPSSDAKARAKLIKEINDDIDKIKNL